jgi:ADP-ribose pyrophosphatase
MNITRHRWKGIALVEQTLTLPNQKEIVHTCIQHPGAAVILPVTSTGEIVLVKQYRPSIQSWILELPAGTLELNEQPLAAAKRELQEETGYTAADWQALGVMLPLVGFCDEKQHLFVASDASLSHPLNLDDDELIEVVTMTLADIEQAIATGAIVDSKTIGLIYKSKLNRLIS